ncbi:DUF4129 domain-containing protein [Deinococcus sp. SDU3-2]|uniref:DUF4129 domain-containing protein n=1 Tax=Deinococcus terrestris TaxID=2651870 RepID=A0A7X1NUS4_9DEIO|nr:DUF4129 domain-containing protein [Deinococcus terrestris]MPY66188.1 DUF4129 domain-containing protein [Deinococcus terrestris]
MTTLPVPPARRPLRLDRSWLLLAAPFVAASWLPWWGVLAFFAVLLLIRFDQAAEVVRVPLLLAAACLTALPLLAGVGDGGGNAMGAILAYAALFLPVVLTAAVLHIGLNLLEVGRPAGAVWLALLLLPGVLGLAPSPVFGLPAGLGLGLLALLLCALGSTGREERPARRLTGSGRAVWNAALIGGVLAGLLALGTLALGPSAQPMFSLEGGAATEQQGEAPVSSSESISEGTVMRQRAPSGPLPAEAVQTGVQLPGADLVLLGGMLLLMSVIFLLWRLPKRVVDGPRRLHWWEIAAVAGMLLLGAMLLFYGMTAGGSGGPGAAPSAPAGEAGVGTGETTGEPAPGWALAFASWFNRVAFASAVLLSIAIFLLAWKLRRPTDDDLQVDLSAEEAASPSAPEALHRVRLAYRSAQASLGAAGLGRGPSETPAEHAARASLNLPDLASPLGTLVTAYAPVRYGGRVTDEDAERAEAAARDIAALSAEYRPLTPPDAPDSPSQETP